MILVIGASGCVGRAVVDRLVSSGHQVKCLWHWGFWHSVPGRVWNCGGDVRNADSIAAAIQEDDVDTVINLASIRHEGGDERFEDVHVQGARNVVEAMKRTSCSRLITLGCLGAEGRSPYPRLRTLGKAEDVVRGSGLNFTILKSGAVFGEGDWLTSWLGGVARGMPLVMPVPHNGDTKLQPIWVGDVAACVDRSLNLRQTFRQSVSIGGPQSLTIFDIASTVLKASGRRRRIVRVPTTFTKQIQTLLARCRGALSLDEMEALSYNRTTDISGVHRVFGFPPAKLAAQLAHLAPDYQPAPPPVTFREQPRWNLRQRALRSR
jgi:NADH dehydrogenase